jgi:hypothetical protein
MEQVVPVMQIVFLFKLSSHIDAYSSSLFILTVM